MIAYPKAVNLLAWVFSLGMFVSALHAQSKPSPSYLTLLPSPLFRGEGLGVRGFALCFV